MPKKKVMKPARVIEVFEPGPWKLEEREAGPNSPFGSSTVVLDGQKVRKNTLIGLGGSTGNATGPHLHFEVRHDPQPWRLGLPHFIPGKVGDKVLAGQEIPFDY